MADGYSQSARAIVDSQDGEMAFERTLWLFYELSLTLASKASLTASALPSTSWR